MKITAEKNGATARLAVSGRVDSSSSGELQLALLTCFGDIDHLVVDALGLEYISSAGLRALLAARKKCANEVAMEIVNVSPEVRGILDVTGFSDLIPITNALREVDVEGCELVGSGASGECLRLDDETIVKLYREGVSDEEIEREKRLAKQAFVLGVPTAISYDVVRSGDRKGVIYELLNAKTLTSLIREDYANIDRYAAQYAAMCRLIHTTDAAGLGLERFKDVNCADVPNISDITDGERELLYRFLDLVPEATTCVHGDLNPNNVMSHNGELCLIDMGEFSTGFAMYDISRLMFTLVYAAPSEGETYNFYNLKVSQCTELWRLFLLHYFGADTLEGAAALNPDAAWVEPLAQFRCVASMLKGTRFGEDKRALAKKLLRDELIPFIERAR